MAQFEVIMPKMGESIEEATITNWFVKEGDKVEEDDVLLEIATDKVDSEIPSPVEGVVKKIMYQQDEVVAVGSVIAIIDLDGEGGEDSADEEAEVEKAGVDAEILSEDKESESPSDAEPKAKHSEEVPAATLSAKSGDRFYSPLVRKIASEEHISQQELDAIEGSGLNGRVQKKDVLDYLEKRRSGKPADSKPAQTVERTSGTDKKEQMEQARPTADAPKASASLSSGDEIIKMDRMRKIIAEHMIRSKQTSAHVTNMIEADVTNIVNWRNKHKDAFLQREGTKLTYLPVFLEATIKALKDFPRINSSVDGENIIVKKNINLGVAVALPDNNLIVPVIKNADDLNIAGLAKAINKLASNARNNKLSPDDIQGGTFTVTNFGSFGNTIGTPIINQPQVAILAVGAIEKKPAVLETPHGDVIAIRHKMFLSLTYDHRIIDGALGGSYLKRLADYLEDFDPEKPL